jgi:hypothetical protein
MSDLSPYPPVAAFLDERFEELGQRTRMIVGCCLFGHNRWMALHGREAEVGRARRKRRVQAIDNLLSSIGGVGVLVYADLPGELLTPHEIDGTADIPRMSRIDNVWSQLTLSAVFASLAWLQHSGVSVGAVNLYYDRKDLTAAHRTQFENILRQILPETAKEARTEYSTLFKADARELRFDTIRGVEKPVSWASADAFQCGTDLAHHFCAQASAVIGRRSEGHTLVRDHTEVVIAMLSKFTHASDEDGETGRESF